MKIWKKEDKQAMDSFKYVTNQMSLQKKDRQIQNITIKLIQN